MKVIPLVLYAGTGTWGFQVGLFQLTPDQTVTNTTDSANFLLIINGTHRHHVVFSIISYDYDLLHKAIN